MNIDFKKSQTRENLLRAFAGESQARNRYAFAAKTAREKKLPVLEAVFLFTAEQEKEHAQIFYNYLNECAGESIKIEGTYPIDVYSSMEELLRAAQGNEYHENDVVYKDFGDVANEEGFSAIGHTFHNIAAIEKVHGDRFGYFANLMEHNELFVANAEAGWMCLNCGYVINASKAPEICPVCKHDQGYFIRLELAPYSSEMTKEFINNK